MDLLQDSLTYISENQERFLEALRVHVELSVYSVVFAMVLFLPLGLLTSRWLTGGPPIVGAVAAARVVPSIAVMFLLFPYRQEIGQVFPFWSTSFTLALVALTLLAGPPMIINADAGLRGVDRFVLESARGLGMNEFQVFARVQLPLALPVMIAGIRTATVEIIASATLAAFIGAGGLGRFITSGLTLYDFSLLLVGAVPVTLLALSAEVSLAGIERLVTPPAAIT